ncbi:hypothetical protein D3C81_1467580 [compost metagenome]
MFDGFLVILSDPFALEVHQSQVSVRSRIALCGSLLIPFEGLFIVLRGSLTF